MLDFIYRIKLIYSKLGEPNKFKIEENKDYHQVEEEGKCNNSNKENNQSKIQNIDKIHQTDETINKNQNGSYMNKNTKRINFDESKKFQSNHNYNINYNHEFYLKNNYTDFTKNQNEDKDKNLILDNSQRSYLKFKVEEKLSSFDNISDNPYENYVISETHRSNNLIFGENMNQEVSNDYIQSTMTNNLINLNNTNFTNYSSNNNLLQNLNKENTSKIINNFNTKKQTADNFNITKIHNFEFYSHTIDKPDTFIKNEIQENNNLKIDRNINVSLKPDFRKKLIEIQNNYNNSENYKKNYEQENFNNSDSVYSKKIIDNISDLKDEILNENNNLKTKNYSTINSRKDEYPNKRELSEMKVNKPYDNNKDKRNNNFRFNEKLISEKNYQIKNNSIDKKYDHVDKSPKLKEKKKENFSNILKKKNNKSTSSSDKSNFTSYYDGTLTQKPSNYPRENKSYNIKKTKYDIVNNHSKNKINSQKELKINKIQPIKFERNEIYKRNEISQLNIFMGSIIKNKIEINSQKIDYFLFHKLTNPIINMDYDSIKKMKFSHTLDITGERFVNVSYEVILTTILY